MAQEPLSHLYPVIQIILILIKNVIVNKVTLGINVIHATQQLIIYHQALMDYNQFVQVLQFFYKLCI